MFRNYKYTKNNFGLKDEVFTHGEVDYAFNLIWAKMQSAFGFLSDNLKIMLTK